MKLKENKSVMIKWSDIKVGKKFVYSDSTSDSMHIVALNYEDAEVIFVYGSGYRHRGLINQRWVSLYGSLFESEEVYLKKIIFRGQLAEL